MSTNLHLVITVHGIRTYGQWQSRLKKLLESTEPGITVLNEKYGYFSILGFIIPLTRWLVTRRFRRRLLDIVHSKPWSRVDLVGHSFGTHLIGWGLQRIPSADRPHIHTIILAGSVLKPGFPWEEFLGKSVNRLVNECGTKDAILILNQIGVLFTGMAGRVGFHGLTGDSFQNRYYQFGHSDYFTKNGDLNDEFMRTSWVPLLTSDGSIPEIDDRQYPKGLRGALAGIGLWALNNAEPIKLMIYVAPFIALTLWIYSLYQNAEKERRLAVARQLAVQSERLFDRPSSEVELCGLLAVESINASQTLEGSASLIRVLSVLPRPVRSRLACVDEMDSDRPVAASPNGKYLATVGREGALLLWDLTGATKRVLAQTGFYPWLLAFSGDGKRLAASNQATVRVWDVITARELPNIAVEHFAVTALAFSHNGEILATEDNEDVVQVWSLADRREIFRQILPPATPSEGMERPVLALSDTGYYLARARESWVQVWSTNDSANGLWRSSRLEDVRLLAFSALYLAVADKNTVRIYYPIDGTEVAEKAIDDEETAALLFGGHDADPILATSGKWNNYKLKGGTVRLWRINQDTERLENVFHVDVKQDVKAIAFTQDNQSLIAVLRDGAVRAWKVATGLQLAETKIKIPGERVVVSAQSRYGHWNAQLTRDGTVRVWDVAADQQVGNNMIAKGVPAVTISDDGQWLATASNIGVVQIWAVGTGQPVVSMKWNPLDSARLPRLLSISTDGPRLAVGGHGRAYVWEVPTGRPIAQVGEGVMRSVAMSPNGQWLASSGKDGTNVWDVEKQQRIASLGREVGPMVFSSNGRLLITSSRSGVEVWDAKTGRRRSQLTHDTELVRLALSPNGRWLAIGDDGGTLRVIDVNNEDQVFEHERNGAGNVMHIAFSSDGRWLISVYPDKTITWPWQKADVIREACDRLQRNLTCDEWAHYLGTAKYKATCEKLPIPKECR